jgi:hypothetical protein
MPGEIKHFNENQGMIITDENNDTFFGVGTLEPELEYMLLSETKNPEFEKTYLAKLNTAITLRNACFIWDPLNQTIYYFENINSFEEDDDVLRKIKIKKALEKIQAFNILPNQIVLISLDTPYNPNIQSHLTRFHKDAFVIALLHPTIKSILLRNTNEKLLASNYSDYTCIEYRNECVSTTLENPTKAGDYIRFGACPGTILCLNNKEQEHSSPWSTLETKEVDRSFGNKIISEIKEGRKLYRTQYVAITRDELNSIIRDLDAKITEPESPVLYTTYNLGLSPRLDNELNPDRDPFNKIPLQRYIASRRSYEIGGTRRKKYKSKSKTKKSKPKTKKSKPKTKKQ